MERTTQGKDFEFILMVKMETRHPIDRPFGSEFLAICNCYHDPIKVVNNEYLQLVGDSKYVAVFDPIFTYHVTTDAMQAKMVHCDKNNKFVQKDDVIIEPVACCSRHLVTLTKLLSLDY